MLTLFYVTAAFCLIRAAYNCKMQIWPLLFCNKLKFSCQNHWYLLWLLDKVDAGNRKPKYFFKRRYNETIVLCYLTFSTESWLHSSSKLPLCHQLKQTKCPSSNGSPVSNSSGHSPTPVHHASISFTLLRSHSHARWLPKLIAAALICSLNAGCDPWTAPGHSHCTSLLQQ